MDAHREKYERHPWVEGNQEVISGVLERIRADGATASRHFERPEGPRPEAWTWYGGKPARQALDHLWSCGDLMVARRESGFQRVYDVTERIIPGDLLAVRPSAEERQRFFTSGALRALGVATARWAADYFRTWARPHSTAKESLAGLKVLQDEGLAVPITVEGLNEPAWLDATLLPRLAELRAGRGWPTPTTLLSPFDNLIWHRGRMADLWNFHYRIEVYTPAPKRVYGYYTMPILHRSKLVGRLDPSTRPQEPAPHRAQGFPGTGRAGDGVAGSRHRRGALGLCDISQRGGGPSPHGRAGAVRADAGRRACASGSLNLVVRWTNGSYEIDDDRSRPDMDRIVAWLAESYWAGTQPEAAVRRSWDAAGVTLGLYHGGQMIGCARAITDFTRFAYLSDVYVEPEHRGHGLGRWLVQTMLDHPDVPRVRWVLHTRGATTRFYEQFGFELVTGAEEHPLMQRPRPADRLAKTRPLHTQYCIGITQTETTSPTSSRRLCVPQPKRA